MNKLENKEIKHQIDIEYYENGQANKILELLDNANKEISKIIKQTKGIYTKERYKKVSTAIKKVSNTLRAQVENNIDIESIVDYELNSQRKLLKEFGDLTDDFVLPTAKQVAIGAEFLPILQKVTFSSYLDGIEQGLFNTWDTAVRTGYITGESSQSIVKRVLGSVAENAKLAEAGEITTLKNSIWRNTRTALQSFMQEAKLQVFKKNENLFDGFKFISTLDRRTCVICGRLDGKIFNKLEDVPKLPLHYNCRCTIVPYIKGLEELSTTRASADGQIDAKITYSDWLAKQDDETQREILGASRYKLYKNGEPIDTFVNNGRVLTIKELEEKVGSDEVITSNVDKGKPKGIIDELKDIDIFKQVKDEDKKELFDDLSHVSLDGQKTLAKYAKNMQGDLYAKTEGYYSPSKNAIYLNINQTNKNNKNIDIRSVVRGFKKDTYSFLHESGHWLDYNMLGNEKTIRSKLPDLRKKARSDVINWINGQLKDKEIIVKSVANMGKLPYNIQKELWEKLGCEDDRLGAKLNSISDIFSGLTQHNIYGQYHHTGWKGDMIEQEIVAHFFAARNLGGEQVSLIKQFLPTSFEYFENLIRSL